MAYVGSVVVCIPSFVLFGIEEQPAYLDSMNASKSTSTAWNTSQTFGEGLSNFSPLGHSTNASNNFNFTYITFLYNVNLNPIAKDYDGIIHKVYKLKAAVINKGGILEQFKLTLHKGFHANLIKFPPSLPDYFLNETLHGY